MKKSLPEHLEKELHPTKNGNVKSSADLISTATKIWWLGECGHEWEARIAHRLKGSDCPYCAGQKVLAGFNDFATTNPELVKEWDSSENNFQPHEITSGSARIVHWVCSKNHKWVTPVKRRTISKTGCPYCTGHKILAGYNDLPTLHPAISEEWDAQKNGSTSSGVNPGLTKKVWWKCAEGHKWQTTVQLRTNGSNCPTCMIVVSSANKREPKSNKSLKYLYPEIAEQWSTSKNELAPDQVNSKTTQKVWWECDKGHEWKTRVSNRTYHKTGCPVCVTQSFASVKEKEVTKYLKLFFPSLITNTRNVLPNHMELDVYIPEKNIAVEFNGVYWHSEATGKPRTYHYDKWKTCKDQGIQLIQVWEDDWDCNPELVKQMLIHKLGVSSSPKVYARKTTIHPLSSKEAKTFLEENHIQGQVSGSIRVGLKTYINGLETLIAVMVLKVEPGTQNKTLNLLRFATSMQTQGGFTKLLKWVEGTFNPEQIVTFSDNTVSDGGLYKNNGFVNMKIIPPDYTYVVKGKRVHKFNYRLKKFREDNTLLFEETLSERELALLNKIPRIWDAGKVKWVKTCIV